MIINMLILIQMIIHDNPVFFHLFLYYHFFFLTIDNGSILGLLEYTLIMGHWGHPMISPFLKSHYIL